MKLDRMKIPQNVKNGYQMNCSKRSNKLPNNMNNICNIQMNDSEINQTVNNNAV